MEALKKESTSEDSSDDHIDYHLFYNLLLRRRDELLSRSAEYQQQIEQQRSLGGAPGDDADLSVIDLNADYYLKLADSEREELQKIKDSLERIHVGNYGFCESCGDTISVKRLKALPHTKHCVTCQAEEESQRLRITPRPYPKM